ncbi:DNA/RNA nuclease SfsA [Salinibacillus xinjiangensis]|uniref:Sugar fermentation stimulation protein homolog n=1 Tax=Salinibacillus xinjiangensis TaxID=1229268 RepID=A0A6G1X4A6_9BACI|nr:DNA/RNA nuclease SfsA [Salinibacillus xinjiangensis]MRG85794.1 DNA/RNA nuclease SfsA [Salinibacillus xinjiangensis]
MFLPYDVSLHQAIFLERENRFILTCKLVETSEIITVHLQDPGRLKKLLVPNNTLYVSYHDAPHRKTKWTAELVKKPDDDILVSLRSTLPNQLVRQVLQQGRLQEFEHLLYVKQEYTYGGSRWDFLLKGEEKPYLLEVKSVTMEEGSIGYFPDAPTKRGKKHVMELTEIQRSGSHQTGVLFVCQREDIQVVRPADWIDADFASALKVARQAGVELKARSCQLTLEGIGLGKQIPVEV